MFLSNSKIIKIFNDSEATLSLLYDALKDTPYERSEISRVVDLRAAATKLEQRMPGPIQPGFVHSKDYADRRHADALLKRYSREVQPPRNVAERHLISLASLYQTMYAQDRGLLLPPIAVSREPILEPPEKIPAFRIVNPIIRSHKHLRATREQLSTPNHHPYSAAISNRGTREVTIG